MFKRNDVLLITQAHLDHVEKHSHVHGYESFPVNTEVRVVELYQDAVFARHIKTGEGRFVCTSYGCDELLEVIGYWMGYVKSE